MSKQSDSIDLRKVARHYISKKLSPIPVDKNKIPIAQWRVFQERFMTEEEIEKYFSSSYGIGVVCGKISGGKEGYHLTVFDIDTKYFDDQITYEEICNQIPKEIFDKLFISTTKSGGYHWYVRSQVSGKNKKYAMRPTSEKEREVEPKELVKVLCENRMEGGMVVSISTLGYNLVSKVREIPYLTQDEFHTIEDVLSSFNRVINEASFFEQQTEERKNKFLSSPWDDYNKKESALSIMLDNGYSVVGGANTNKIKIKRSGSTASPHSGYIVDNKYVNFSTSTQFESGKSYTAAELFTILYCSGSWAESYKSLIEKGYGHNVDMSVKVKEFVKAFRENDLLKLLELHFSAKKVENGVEINNKVFNITLK